MAPNVQTAGKRRFIALDSMRGVAAIAVVVRHFGQTFHRWEPNSYLAVDLFFVLSGFVLALNYDSRFSSGMTAMTFMRLRATRLLPFAIIGAMLGLASQFVSAPTSLSTFQSFASAMLTAAALPTPPLANPRILFPLNTAFWSLFFELWVANLVFALFWRWLRGPTLWLVIVAGAVGVLISERHFHTMDIGWSWSNVYGGFPRVGFSFFSGVAIQRLDIARSSRRQIPSWVCLVVLVAALCLPLQGAAANLTDLAFVLFLFPGLVYFGATAVEKNRRIGTILGDVSYGIYTIHVPLLVLLALIFRPFATLWTSMTSPTFFALETLFIVAMVGLAFVLDAKVDRPVRKLLLTWTDDLGLRGKSR
jgi:peptidoglycan/LPS O-acetylase OafA/YrhL